MTRPINITVSNNMNRETITATSDITIREAFERAGVNPGNGFVSIDGAPISAGDFDKSFDALGITTDKVSVFSIKKADNA